MKRSVFIIIGVVLVLVLIAVWLYVLFFSTPPSVNEDQFGNPDFRNTTDIGSPEPSDEPRDEPVVDVQANERLRQLTTRPVAGYTELQASTSTPREVLYMEVGTGHIYSINLTTGEEDRVSATTITGAQRAEFSENGQYVMIRTGFTPQKEFLIGEINRGSSTLSHTELAEPISSFSSTNDNRFLYSIQSTASTIGKVFNPAEFTNETIFTIPFREASVEWGSNATSSHYVYPKATRQLESFLYRIENGVISRTLVDGFGMSALGTEDNILYSRQENDTYVSYYLDVDSSTISELPLIQIPEKCVMSEGTSAFTICANTDYAFSNLLPDSWYKGEVLTTDSLWEINSSGDTATFLINPELTAGRALDITQLQITNDGFNIYFTNQTNQTLWIYERIPANTNQN